MTAARARAESTVEIRDLYMLKLRSELFLLAFARRILYPVSAPFLTKIE